jgi:outer membrane protein OmpA-like peptidoglycan-associated protein
MRRWWWVAGPLAACLLLAAVLALAGADPVIYLSGPLPALLVILGVIVTVLAAAVLAARELRARDRRRAAADAAAAAAADRRRLLMRLDHDVCSDVLFDFDRSDIRADAEAVLRQVVDSLNKRFRGRAIQVDGHTDSQGSDAYNDSLSVRRAEAVKQWLAGHGIAASRIATHGYGETEPVASNASEDRRQRNRRVVIGVSKG